MISPVQEALKVSAAIKAFLALVKAGTVTLPDGLQAPNPGDPAMFPYSIIVNQLVVPIDYDPIGNVITLAV